MVYAIIYVYIYIYIYIYIMILVTIYSYITCNCFLPQYTNLVKFGDIAITTSGSHCVINSCERYLFHWQHDESTVSS